MLTTTPHRAVLLAAALVFIAVPARAVPARAVPARAAPASPARHPAAALVSLARHLKAGPSSVTAGAPPATGACERSLRVACYQPSQLRHAYDLSPLYQRGVTGKGATIVIVDPFGSPTIRSDLHRFDAAFGLPGPRLSIITPAGTPPSFDKNSGEMTGWAYETSLDVEWAHVVAPGAAIVLAETPADETEGTHGFPQIVAAEEYVIRHHLGDVISQSFAATEPTFGDGQALAALRGAYRLAQREHVTVLAASGDAGATGPADARNTFYQYPVTSWPASDPLVTAVGGTQLHLTAQGARTSPDTVWNDTANRAATEFTEGDAGPDPLASGGGQSVYFARPGYQEPGYQGNGVGRQVPDIAMSAACDGAVDVYASFPGGPGGWTEECGTSEATPLFAGVVALADQMAGHPLGLIGPALYRLARDRAPGIVPVTRGNNTVSFRQGGRLVTVRGYPARAGYSMADGVGTVDARYLVPELAGKRA